MASTTNRSSLKTGITTLTDSRDWPKVAVFVIGCHTFETMAEPRRPRRVGLPSDRDASSGRVGRLVVGVTGWRVASNLAWIAFVVATARQLGPSGRGEIVLIMTLCLMATIALGLGSNI